MWRYLVAFLVILGLSLCALAAWGRSAENCSFDSPPGQALCERFVTRDLNTLDSPEANATTYYDNTAATAVTCTDATEAKGIVDFDPAPGTQTWGICYGTTRLDFANILTSETQSVFKTIDTSSGTDPVADITTDTLILTGTAPIVVTGDATEDSVTISCSAASGSNAGCLSSTDWTAFNGKDGSTTNEINTITADDTNTTSGLAITAAGGAGILTSVVTNTLTIATASTEANFLTNGTSPPACSGYGALWQNQNAGAGNRLNLCVDGAFVGVDNPFGTRIDGNEWADEVILPGSGMLNLNTYSAGLRLAVTSSDPGLAGQLVIDSTSYAPQWYAGSALREAVTLDATQTITGHKTFTSTTGLVVTPGTSDGSDTATITIAAGPTAAYTRGAFLQLFGNEVAAGYAGGILGLNGGDQGVGGYGGYVNINTGGVNRINVDYDGDVCVLTGAAANSCTRTLGISGTAARTLGLETQSGNLVGYSLTINAGGSGSGASNNNLAGGNLVLASGSTSGNGTSTIDFQTVDANQGSGSTQRTAATRFRLRDGHVVSLGTVPTTGTCPSTTATSIAGTDSAGRVVMSADGTVCTVTFAKAYTTNVACTVVSQTNTGGARISSISTSAFTVTFGTSGTHTFNYLCMGFE